MEGESNAEVGGTTQSHAGGSGGGGQDTWAKPTVACLRCRDQKLRCDRDLPSCRRCHKQKAACSYPPPPDRRRIAQKTSQARASALAAMASIGAPEQQQQQGQQRSDPTASAVTAAAAAAAAATGITVSKLGKRQRVNDPGSEDPLGTHDSASSDAQPKAHPAPGLGAYMSDGADLPPTEIGLLLLEVYFKRVYHASLLFHKSIAFQLYRQNGIPDYLLRAIFAQAAVFLQQVDSPYKQHIDIFPVHSISEKSWSWARSASREVLSNVDEPTLVRVQALQVLHLYYYSRGLIQRAMVHASLAYQLCQVLGYDRLHDDPAVHPTSRSLQLDQEMKRRCFWACWTSLCMGGYHSQSGNCRTLEMLKDLPLPARFEKTGSVQGVELKLGQKMEGGWKLSVPALSPTQGMIAVRSPCSLMAEMVKITGVWSHVQTFITESPRRSTAQRTLELGRLMEIFEPIERSLELPLTDIYARAEFYNESPEILTSICSMYHLSRLLVHASMVPSLSGYPLEATDSGETVQQHTDAALRQASRFAELLQQFATKDSDMTRLWHFTGYGAFVVGSLFVMYQDQGPSSAERAVAVPRLDSEEIKTIQTVLEVLSIYWEPLRGLKYKLNKAIHTGKYTDMDSIASPTFSWEKYRSGSVSEDYDDTISVPNNPNTHGPLFRSPFVRLMSEGQQFHDMLQHDDSNSSPEQGLGEHQHHHTNHHHHHPQQHMSPHSKGEGGGGVPERLSSQPTPDYGSQFMDDSMGSSSEGGLFDVNWGNTLSTINIWGQAAPSLVELPSRDPVLFF